MNEICRFYYHSYLLNFLLQGILLVCLTTFNCFQSLATVPDYPIGLDNLTQFRICLISRRELKYYSGLPLTDLAGTRITEIIFIPKIAAL